ncbi:MAG: hypothetical protein R3B84_16110 [Zavarzinella sp.]
MKNMFALVGMAALAFAGAGWYLGWYNISRKSNETGKQDIAVELNTGKILEDGKKGLEKAKDVVENLASKKDAPKEQGPASSFFLPANEEKSSGGWRKIDDNAPEVKVPQLTVPRQ